MSVPIVISILGGILAVGGFFIEFIACVTAAFYPIRRRLPSNSPFDLLSLGGNCLIAGVGLVVLGILLQ